MAEKAPLRASQRLLRVYKEGGEVVEIVIANENDWSIFNESILEVKEKGGSSIYYFPLVNLSQWEVKV